MHRYIFSSSLLSFKYRILHSEFNIMEATVEAFAELDNIRMEERS